MKIWDATAGVPHTRFAAGPVTRTGADLAGGTEYLAGAFASPSGGRKTEARIICN